MSLSRSSQTKSYRYIKIIVNDKEINLKNRDNNVTFPGMDVDVVIQHTTDEKESSSIKLHQINYETAKFFAAINENYHVEIYFSHQKVATKLPDEMSWNLINFFKLYRSKYSDCRSFAYEMAYGRESVTDDYAGFYPKYFDEKSIDSQKQLICGDIVHLYDYLRFNHHFAIFIGQNYYLSLFGRKDGPLIVTTLDAAKKGFHTHYCVQALKKESLNHRHRLFKANAQVEAKISEDDDKLQNSKESSWLPSPCKIL